VTVDVQTLPTSGFPAVDDLALLTEGDAKVREIAPFAMATDCRASWCTGTSAPDNDIRHTMVSANEARAELGQEQVGADGLVVPPPMLKNPSAATVASRDSTQWKATSPLMAPTHSQPEQHSAVAAAAAALSPELLRKRSRSASELLLSPQPPGPPAHRGGGGGQQTGKQLEPTPAQPPNFAGSQDRRKQTLGWVTRTNGNGTARGSAPIMIPGRRRRVRTAPPLCGDCFGTGKPEFPLRCTTLFRHPLHGGVCSVQRVSGVWRVHGGSAYVASCSLRVCVRSVQGAAFSVLLVSAAHCRLTQCAAKNNVALGRSWPCGLQLISDGTLQSVRSFIVLHFCTGTG
jgi:hypothetical protein